MPKIGDIVRITPKLQRLRRNNRKHGGTLRETYLTGGYGRQPGHLLVHDLASVDANGNNTYGPVYELPRDTNAIIQIRPNWKVEVITKKGIEYISGMAFSELVRIGYDPHQSNPLDPSLQFKLIEHLQNLQSFPNGDATVRVMPSIYRKADGTYDIFAAIDIDILTDNVPSTDNQVVVCVWLKTDNTAEVTVSSEETVDTDLKLDPATALTLINECAAAASAGAIGIGAYIIWYDTVAIIAKNKFHDLRGIVGAGGSETAKPNFGSGVIKILASDIVAAGADRHLIIAAQSGTADNLIEVTGLNIGDTVLLRADAGHTITVKHNAGGATIKIHLYNNADVILDELNPLELVLVSAFVLAQPLDISASAPASAKYVVTESDATLSNEITIPGLESSFDIKDMINYATATGIKEDYDSATTGLSWNTTPTTVNSDTTIPSHLFVEEAFSGAQERLAYRTWSPSGACEAQAHITSALNAGANTGIVGLVVGDSTYANYVSLSMNRTTTAKQMLAHSFTGGAYTQRGTTWSIFGSKIYFRITNGGSNDWAWYYSEDGELWNQIATLSFTFTIARVGYRFAANNTMTVRMASDWLRTND